MNKKEAEEIEAQFHRPGALLDASSGAMYDHYEAQGFLEGHEQGVQAERERAKGLVEALEYVQEFRQWINREPFQVVWEDAKFAILCEKVDKALADYKSEKGK